MKKSTKNILIGVGVATASAAVLGVAHHYTTKYLMKLALDREDRSGAGDMLRIKETVDDTDLHHSHRSSFVDIDTNKHTNNVAYLRMVLNCFSPDEFDAMKIDEFQINFFSQTFYGDEIKIYKKKTDYGIFIEGKHNGIAVFNCFVISAKAQ